MASRSALTGVQSLGRRPGRDPDGYEAVTLNLDYVAAGANTIIPGDMVNVYLQREPGPDRGQTVTASSSTPPRSSCS